MSGGDSPEAATTEANEGTARSDWAVSGDDQAVSEGDRAVSEGDQEEPAGDSSTSDGATTTDPTGNDATDPEILRGQLALLEEENRRLRREYARTRQVSYRKTAHWLGLIGGVAIAGGIVAPAVREVLLVLGAIGLFGGVLTYYLTPTRIVAAETGERIYATLDDTVAALAEQLNLRDRRVYVPYEGDPPVRLFVPVHERYEIPEGEALRSPLVVGETEAERGLALVPAGAYLFEEFEQTLTDPFGPDIRTATEQLADGLVEGFELADTTAQDSNPADGRITVRVDGSVYGGTERFDNPLASFVAVGLVDVIEKPVSTTVTAADAAGSFTVTCRWDGDED